MNERNHRIYTMSVSRVYPLYITKVEKKGRTKDEVDQVMCWLTGYSKAELKKVMADGTDFETFFSNAPAMNPLRSLITGMICGVRIEEIEEPELYILLVLLQTP